MLRYFGKIILALSSAVSMNIDEKASQDGSSVVGHDNDSPTYSILHNSTSKRSEVRCCEKNNPLSSMVVGIDEGSKSSYRLGNEYEIKTWKLPELRAWIMLERIMMQ